jgi:hypothetical protein
MFCMTISEEATWTVSNREEETVLATQALTQGLRDSGTQGLRLCLHKCERGGSVTPQR